MRRPPMTDHHANHGPKHPQPDIGFEREDLGTNPVIGFIITLVISGILIYYVIWGIFIFSTLTTKSISALALPLCKSNPTPARCRPRLFSASRNRASKTTSALNSMDFAMAKSKS